MLTATSSRLLPLRTVKVSAGIAAGLLLYSSPTLVTCDALGGVQSALMIRQAAALHGALIGACAGIAGLVFAILIHSIVAYRGSGPDEAPTFRRHPIREALWALVPVVVIVLMAWPAVSALRDGPAIADTGTQAGFQCRVGALSASSTVPTR